MEDDRQKKRNVRPVEKSKLPVITLFILTALVVALLFVGYDYLTDDPGDTNEVTNTDGKQEVVSLEAYDQPSQIDANASGPAPVPGSAGQEAKSEPKKEEKSEASAAPAAQSTDGKSYVHTAASGETISSIATRYNLTQQTLKSLNPSIKEGGLKSGQKVNVRVQAVHTVGPGDILRVVGKKYGVSVDLIMRANNKNKNFAERGEKLVIPFPEKK
ncbi:hypothetical protein GCM10023091_14850 [Ravibacter arvi]|uniref:LysM domain-containing protein n=1 Tax=Ravibacter arvi TaxID=2051041 RepID=A0ABP8LVK4_9BACT